MMKYYGVYARNGLGIYNDYGKLLKSQKFMCGERIKSFRTEKEAEEYVLGGFISLHSGEVSLLHLEDSRINWFYYYKDFRNALEVIR